MGATTGRDPVHNFTAESVMQAAPRRRSYRRASRVMKSVRQLSRFYLDSPLQNYQSSGQLQHFLPTRRPHSAYSIPPSPLTASRVSAVAATAYGPETPNVGRSCIFPRHSPRCKCGTTDDFSAPDAAMPIGLREQMYSRQLRLIADLARCTSTGLQRPSLFRCQRTYALTYISSL